MEQKEVIRIALVSSLGTFLLVAVIGGGGYFAYTKVVAGWIEQYQAAQETKTIIRDVGEVVLLPEDDTPQIATISNAEQLKKGDTFFASAKNGDATLFYKTSGIVILFDLEAHKLLNMGVIATSSESASETAPASSFNFTK